MRPDDLADAMAVDRRRHDQPAFDVGDDLVGTGPKRHRPAVERRDKLVRRRQQRSARGVEAALPANREPAGVIDDRVLDVARNGRQRRRLAERGDVPELDRCVLAAVTDRRDAAAAGRDRKPRRRGRGRDRDDRQRAAIDVPDPDHPIVATGDRVIAIERGVAPDRHVGRGPRVRPVVRSLRGRRRAASSRRATPASRPSEAERAGAAARCSIARHHRHRRRRACCRARSRGVRERMIRHFGELRQVARVDDDHARARPREDRACRRPTPPDSRDDRRRQRDPRAVRVEQRHRGRRRRNHAIGADEASLSRRVRAQRCGDRTGHRVAQPQAARRCHEQGRAGGRETRIGDRAAGRPFAQHAQLPAGRGIEHHDRAVGATNRERRAIRRERRGSSGDLREPAVRLAVREHVEPARGAIGEAASAAAISGAASSGWPSTRR